MSSTIASGQAPVAPIACGLYPDEGSRCVSLQFDWRTRASYTDDLSQLMARGLLTTVQTAVVDNTGNAQSVSLTCFDTGQTIVCPAYAMGYFPIFVTGGLIIVSTDRPVVATTRVELVNVPIGPAVSGLQPSLDLDFMTGVLDPRIAFTRSSANGSYFDSTGALQVAGINTPRFDYDPATLTLRGLLIEEFRTNLFLNNAVLATQNVATIAVPYTLSFYGTGTVTLSGTSTAGPLVGAGPMPTRVSMTFTPTAGVLTATVTGSVLNAQIEQGTFATSVILNAAIPVTRAADLAVIPVGSWYNAAAGTLTADTMQSTLPGSGVAAVAEFNDATAANRYFLAYTATVGTGRSNDIIASVGAGVVATPNVMTPGQYNKLALSVSGPPGGPTAAAVALNGVAGTITWAPGLPPGITQLQIGSLASANALNGWMRRLRYSSP